MTTKLICHPRKIIFKLIQRAGSETLKTDRRAFFISMISSIEKQVLKNSKQIAKYVREIAYTLVIPELALDFYILNQVSSSLCLIQDRNKTPENLKHLHVNPETLRTSESCSEQTQVMLQSNVKIVFIPLVIFSKNSFRELN